MASRGRVEAFFHGKRCRLAESGMRVPADLAVAQRGEEGDVVGQRDAHAKRHRGDPSGARRRFDLSDEPPRQPPTAMIRQNGKPAEINLLVPDLVEDAADKARPVQGDDTAFVAKPFRHRCHGFAQRARRRRQLAVILREAVLDYRHDLRRIVRPCQAIAYEADHRFLQPIPLSPTMHDCWRSYCADTVVWFNDTSERTGMT